MLLLLARPPASAAPAERGDEETLHSAGLSTDGPALLAFFHARARTDIDPEHLRDLLRRFASPAKEERGAAMAELLGLGPLALPVLRKAANDLDHPEVAERASRCLPWLEGPSSNKLLAAAASVLARRKPDGAAAALLAYLPFADNPDVLRALNAALAEVAAPGGKLDPALLRGLADPLGVRRAASGIALARAMPPDRTPAVRNLLKDPAPGVRLRAALALAEAHDADAIPVLIDLLGVLSFEERKRVEEFLTRLAGEWAPVLAPPSDDKISRKIRQDAWAGWWRNTDGASLLAAVREQTRTPEGRTKIAGLIARLNNEEFVTRENASKELFALGRIALPQLREAAKSKDAELSTRAHLLIDRIEREPAYLLPAAAIRLLAVRKPAGSVEALLAYLPFADSEPLSAEVQKSLVALARPNDNLDPVLVRALAAGEPNIRAAAGEALATGGGPEGCSAVRKLLSDAAPTVRLRVALALATASDQSGMPTLIELLTVLPDDQVGQVEDVLFQLAGETAPEVPVGVKREERKKCRDAWAAWWKINAARVDLARLTVRPSLGYTLLCDLNGNRVFEVDRQGKQRWLISNAGGPVDARILPGNRVLIAEYGADRVTERDFNGNILWERRIPNPVNVQRLPNGNTFVATVNGPIVELDRAGNEVWRMNNLPGNIMAGARSRRGTIICLTQNGQCFILDAAGKQLGTFASGHHQQSMGGIDVLANGRILVAQPNRNKVVEFDSEGKVIREVDAPNSMAATGLPNGHILATSQNTQRACELDRSGKIVWEYTSAGQVYRARRR
jgi:HEAT repeat protein